MKRLIVILLVGCFQLTISKNGQRASVVSNAPECAEIGMSFLLKGGSAADAAIAVSICEMVALPQMLGIGGGFFATIYDPKEDKVVCLKSQSRAPINSHRDMFDDRNSEDWTVGGLSIAVPGDLKGLHALHDKYGIVPWADLMKPSIELCRKGITVSDYHAYVFGLERKHLLEEPTLRKLFVDPKTNDTYKVGDVFRQLKLAESLEIIAKEKSDAMYSEHGSLINGLVEDIQKFGGIITKEDFIQYKAVWDDPVVLPLPNKLTLYTTPPSSSGPILAAILNIMSGYEKEDTGLYWHRLVESFKFAFPHRMKIGDPDFVDTQSLKQLVDPSYGAEIRRKIVDSKTFDDPEHYGFNASVPEDHGTGNIAVVGLNGDAVTMTSSINHYFGSKRVSPSSGIVLNNAMDDFSSPNKEMNGFLFPPSEASYIVPGKMQTSSMSPSIILDSDRKLKLVIGAAGGSKIPTAVAFNIIKTLWLNETIEDTVWAKRIHHQLIPNEVELQTGFDKNIWKELENRGHKIKETEANYSLVVGIDAVRMVGAHDPRTGSVVNIG